MHCISILQHILYMCMCIATYTHKYIMYLHRYENIPKKALMEKLVETERELKKYQERFRCANIRSYIAIYFYPIKYNFYFLHIELYIDQLLLL